MSITVRPLQAEDLPEADRICRVAFGTFLGLPDPTQMFGDADYVKTRFRAAPSLALAAEVDGRLAGSAFVAVWGSVGFFGPVSVRPDLWDQGVARRLLDGAMTLFDRHGVRQRGLFTFPQSAKHVSLYQRYGFWPQYLNAVSAKAVEGTAAVPDATAFSSLAESARERTLGEMRALTSGLVAGFDPTGEAVAVAEQRLGETLLVRDGGDLAAFAVCHAGPGTEAGGGALYVKFGAARSGPGAAGRFERLLRACETHAAALGLERVVAGASAARHGAYRTMLARGYRPFLQGVIMQSPNEKGTHRPDVWAIDDWR